MHSLSHRTAVPNQGSSLLYSLLPPWFPGVVLQTLQGANFRINRGLLSERPSPVFRISCKTFSPKWTISLKKVVSFKNLMALAATSLKTPPGRNTTERRSLEMRVKHSPVLLAMKMNNFIWNPAVMGKMDKMRFLRKKLKG